MSRSLVCALWLLFALLLPAAAAAQDLTRWFLAEGATGAFFEEEILIGNPHAVPADIRITFLKPIGAPVVQTFTMAATSRRTVRVNQIPGLEATAVSARVECTNGLDIVVERSMYWANGTKRGGHNANGVTGTATNWFLAEGSTGFFNTFILFANPDGTATAQLAVTYLETDGTTVIRNYTVAPSSRLTVWVNAEVAELTDAAFSTLVTSTNGVGIAVERAMYWGPGWEGGHGSNAVTGSSKTWIFGEGFTGGNATIQFDTFLLLANPSATGTRANVTYFLESGAQVVRTYDLLPTSRLNVWVDQIPGLTSTSFSMKVESDLPIVAERAMYFGPTSAAADWLDGHSTPGLTAEATKWAFAEGGEDALDTPGILFDSFFLVANTSGQPLDLKATFVREDGSGIVRTFYVPPQARYTIITGAFPELSNQRFSAFLESTNNVPFVAERAVYWGAGYFGGHASPGTPWTAAIATPPSPPPPTVTSISPGFGFVTGGTSVTIVGTGFAQGATVRIGAATAANVSVVSATHITATTTAALAGVSDVFVTSNGTQARLSGGFTYLDPPVPVHTVTGVSPSRGSTLGGALLTITGTNFAAGATVRIGPLVATDVTFVNATTLRARTPVGVAGVYDVTVIIQGRVALRPQAFMYVPANILGFGDSITYGATSMTVSAPLLMDTIGYNVPGYPERMRPMFAGRYSDVPVTVQNAGVSGERASTGRNRLPGLLSPPNPRRDVVIILEGANDIIARRSTSSIAGDLRAMVQTAKAAGSRVLLCTNPPAVDPDKTDIAAIPPLNTEIRKIAAEEGVTLVDLYAIFLGRESIYLSPDGLHPNEAGYDRMALEFFNRIVAWIETAADLPTDDLVGAARRQ